MAYLNQKALYEDLEKYLHAFGEAYCREAQIEITKMAKYAIEQFYEDYEPDYYVRTNNLLKRSYEPYYHNNGKRIYGGVKITSKNMFENYDGVDAAYVADAGWHGWHGMKGSDYMNNWGLIPNIRPIYTTAPLDIVRKMMSEKSFLDKIRNKAEDMAKLKRYSVLKFK